jgi:hypothetical protein
MKALIIIIATLNLAGCSSSDKSIDPSVQAEKITAEYFPMANGDTWYYSSSAEPLMIWSVSGDTLINGVTCKKIMQDLNHYYMACRIDSEGYKIYFRDGLSFNPPFVIGFNWEKGKQYNVSVGFHAKYGGTEMHDTISIPMEFVGYCSKTVHAGSFNNVVKMHYITCDLFDEYYEYYAKGIGLLDEEDYALDSAFIGGSWYK